MFDSASQYWCTYCSFNIWSWQSLSNITDWSNCFFDLSNWPIACWKLQYYLLAADWVFATKIKRKNLQFYTLKNLNGHLTGFTCRCSQIYLGLTNKNKHLGIFILIVGFPKWRYNVSIWRFLGLPFFAACSPSEFT